MKTCLEEFEKFHEALIRNAANDFVPWYFPVKKDGKEPDIQAIAARAPKEIRGKGKFSWKAHHARLTKDEAAERLRNNEGNVGIGATDDDLLMLNDIDNAQYRAQLKKTLTVTTRKGYGVHGYAWAASVELKKNITTDDGELRASWEYVLAPGSYVPISDAELNTAVEKGRVSAMEAEEIKKSPQRGLYHVVDFSDVATFTWEDLPQIYRDQEAKRKEATKNTNRETTVGSKNLDLQERSSALFHTPMEKILPGYDRSDRFPHPLHESDTGANFSISQGLGHCWRHLVSLNTFQFFVVKSGYGECQDVGTPHGGGVPIMKGDRGAVYHAWAAAKKSENFPPNDKIPLSALWYVAEQAEIVPKKYDGDRAIMPIKIYKAAIKYVEELL